MVEQSFIENPPAALNQKFAALKIRYITDTWNRMTKGTT